MVRGEGPSKGDVCRKNGLSYSSEGFLALRVALAAAFALLWLTHTQAAMTTFPVIYFAGMTTFPVILVLTTIGCSLSNKRTSQKPSEHPGNKFLGPQEQRTGMCGKGENWQ